MLEQNIYCSEILSLALNGLTPAEVSFEFVLGS